MIIEEKFKMLADTINKLDAKVIAFVTIDEIESIVASVNTPDGIQALLVEKFKRSPVLVNTLMMALQEYMTHEFPHAVKQAIENIKEQAENVNNQNTDKVDWSVYNNKNKA